MSKFKAYEVRFFDSYETDRKPIKIMILSDMKNVEKHTGLSRGHIYNLRKNKVAKTLITIKDRNLNPNLDIPPPYF